MARARLIAVTGYISQEDRRRSHKVGFELHLAKPVDLGLLEQLLALEAAALRRRGPQVTQG